jgi:hypothetical protein
VIETLSLRAFVIFPIKNVAIDRPVVFGRAIARWTVELFERLYETEKRRRTARADEESVAFVTSA